MDPNPLGATRDTAGATILVVDDTPENLTVMGEVLKPLYKLRMTTSGHRALEIARTPPRPDLVLLDVMMPEMDGYAVLSALRTNPETADIPVIFVTAMDAVEDKQRGLELGAADYITKPIRPTIVLARVRTQLENKQMRDWLKDQNSFLEAEVERRMKENQLIQNVSIHALARLAEIRDPETGNHLLRTQHYLAILARKLLSHPDYAGFLSGRNLEFLIKSAPLHDIGKVGIPDGVLLKPGKLTPEEKMIMRSHARLGYEAIELAERDAEAPVDFLFLAKQIARSHHEHWDGSGYPDGLAGRAIPISARLMALADVFDALTARRKYKAPMPVEEARDAIIAQAGKQFDPAVVAAFQEVFEEFRLINQQYSQEPGPAESEGQPGTDLSGD